MITEKSNRLQVIMITDYDYPTSVKISGLLRLVSKLSDKTCTCLALDLAITARAGHLTDSLCKNLAAVEKKNE